MDAPPIQYARTQDGLNIAYWTLGEGPPILFLEPLPSSHCALWWDYPPRERLYRRIAERRTLVYVDPRGSGLSDWSPEGYDLDRQVQDVEAVAQATGLGGFTVLAHFHGCALAAMLGARRPDLAAALVLWHPWTNEDSLKLSSWRTLQSANDNDPDFAHEVRALVVAGRMDAEFAGMMKLTSQPLDPVAYAARRDFDLTAILPEVRVPTAVVSVRGSRYIDERAAQLVAAAIPDSRLVSLDGRSSRSSLLTDYPTDVLTLLGISPRSATGDTQTVMFTDLAASTATTQRLGDAAAQDLVRAHNDIVRPALAAHDGHEIKHTGDGIMAWFPAASNALDCAHAIQLGVGDLANPDLGVKIGLNAGEPIAEEDDLYGTAVQIAARVTDQAAAGEIVVTNVVRELVAGKGYLFSEREPAALKGVEEPVRLFTLGASD